MGTRALYRKTEIVAAVATVLVGWLLLLPLHTPNPLVRWSYDLLQLVLPHHGRTDPVIIYMDEQAMQDYRLKPGQPWPRSIHARLLDRLTRDQPKVVVFDVTMTQAGDTAEDDNLARAIRENRRVVLAGDKVPVPGVPLGYTIIPPLEQFETNAAGWGTVKVQTDADQVSRQIPVGDRQKSGLAWEAAALAGAPVTRSEEERLGGVRWLNYYGSAHPFESLSMTYTNAESSEAGFFRDKAVFIGGKPETLLRNEITDVFVTPFTKWNVPLTPGVEILAVAYTNLMHNECLGRMNLVVELGLLLATWITVGFGLQRVRVRTAVLLSLLMVGLVCAVSVSLVLYSRLWLPWAVVCVFQLPCALIFRLFAARDLLPIVPEETLRETEFPIPAEPEPVHDGRPEIPDHTLIRCIGKGAYGQVWIARNAIGLYHAVKVVYRSRFGVEEP